MAYIRHEVKSYGVVMYSRTTGERAQRILLYGTDGSIKAWVYFYEGEGALPPPSGSDAPRDITLYYNSERFDSFLNLLQTEKPLWVFYSEEGRYGGINTGAEEIGEEEAR